MSTMEQKYIIGNFSVILVRPFRNLIFKVEFDESEP
jgi:hypothetical protein